ncbi:MAG: hypothetical protein Q8900_10415 [Bacillota bacterium]|nr:hypothetical protein [Bacillota bacterium]
MNRYIKIAKAYYLIDSSGFNIVYMLCMLAYIFLEIVTIGLATIKDYTFSAEFMLFSMSYLQFFISYIVGNTSSKNKKYKTNYNLFLLQLPVSKKELYNTKFLCSLIANVIPLFSIIYLIVLNLARGNNKELSSKLGVIVLVYCIGAIIFSVSLGFQNVSCKKYNFVKIAWNLWFLCEMIILSVLYFVKFFKLFGSNNANMSIENITSIIAKACIPLSGMIGLCILLISTIISYYLCSVLPYKISQKEG